MTESINYSSAESSVSFISEDGSKNILSQSSFIEPIGIANIKDSEAYTVEIPEKIQSIFKNAKDVDFIFKIIPGETINFIGKLCYSIYVLFFEEFIENVDHFTEINTKLIFIFGRQKFISEKKKLFNMSFKESIKKKTRLTAQAFDYETINSEIFDFQFSTQTNIVYIETADSLIKELRNAICILQKDEEYEMKVKKCNSSSKETFLANLLLQIPGISKAMTTELTKRFKSLNELCLALANTPHTIKEIEVADTMQMHRRSLGDHIFKKLHSVFLEYDPSKFI